MATDSSDFRLLRYSVVAVWLGTAVVSVVEWRGQSQDLLRASELMPAWPAAWLSGVYRHAGGLLPDGQQACAGVMPPASESKKIGAVCSNRTFTP